MATVQEVIDNSMTRSMDEYKTQVSDSEAVIFLNQALDYVFKMLVRIDSTIAVSDVSIPLTAGVGSYPLTTYMPMFYKVKNNGVFLDVPLIPISKEDSDREGTGLVSEDPTMFFIDKTVLGLRGIPDATAVAANPNLSVSYYCANDTLTLTSTMPYNGLFNAPLSAYMDHLGVLKIQGQTAEFTALYNALEESAMAIVVKRGDL